MAYTAWSVIAGETPTASKWNIIGANADDANSRITTLEGKKQYARYTWFLPFSVAVGDRQGITYPIPRAQTVKRLTAILNSGVAAFRIKKTNGTVIHSYFDANASGPITARDSGFSNTALADGEFIQLDVVALGTSPSGLSVMLEVEEVLH